MGISSFITFLSPSLKNYWEGGGGASPGYGTDLMTNREDTDNYGDKILIIMVTRRMSEFEELRESNYWKLVTSVHI